MLDRCTNLAPHAEPPAKALRAGHTLLNGPKLDDDVGHASQSDIDKMFG
jgi:chemotaxis protein CheZ